MPRRTCSLGILLLLSCMLGAPFSLAHDEITPASIKKYSDEGTLQERRARIDTLRQFRMTEGNLQRATYKVRRAALEATGLSPAEAAKALTGGRLMAFPFTAQPELKSTGTVKTLTILVDFADHRADTDLPGLTVQGISDNIYGTGTTESQVYKPYESLHQYYRRASEGLVDVQGNVLGWYHFQKKRDAYEPAQAPATLPPEERKQRQALNDNQAIFNMLSEAMASFDAQHDYAQYDNDSDGDIDLVTMIYAGPDTGWGSFWWAYRWQFFVPDAANKKFDGKRVKQFVFQFASTRGAEHKDFNPSTIMHEMGHAFGLADYYDYDSSVGPSGGIGGLDMMDANQGNHNAFSRWLLDWIKPTVVSGGPAAMRSLNASTSNQTTAKAIAIFPNLGSTIAPNQEMFMIENRSRVKGGNDEQLSGDGLLIWHINASVNGSGDDFKFDNSFTDLKLIQLMRADSSDDFGDGGQAGATTYFVKGRSLTKDSKPSSRDNLGNDTGIIVDQIGDIGETMAVRIGFAAAPPTPTPVQPAPIAVQPAAAPLEAAAAKPASVESVLTSKGPLNLDTLEELDRKFTSQTPGDLREAWKTATDPKLSSQADPFTKQTVLKLLLSRWASKDGASSAEAVLQLPVNDPVRVESLPLVMQSWTHNAPAEAAKWYLDEKRQRIRQELAPHSGMFLKRAFEGLYAADPDHATQALDNLSSTPQLISAVDGIVHAASKLDRSKEVTQRLSELKSEVIKAHVHVLEAMRAAEGNITDPKERREFQQHLQEQYRVGD